MAADRLLAMTSARNFRAALAVMLAGLLACPVDALVRMNEGRDQIHATFSASVTHDSNVYANSDSRGDFLYSAGLNAEYVRRAGWIGVNASVELTAARFAEIEDEDYLNPSYNLEFTKKGGRTTGALTMQAKRESRADAVDNLRSESWNHSSSVNVKYPINGVLSASSSLGYSAQDYINESFFSDLRTYAAAVDFINVISSERDLSFGYRYRFTETSRSNSATDHAINVGMQGKLIRGINGGMRVGYQSRLPDTGLPGDKRFNSWTAGGTATYTLNKRTSVTAHVSKDLSMTALEASIDSTSVSLEAKYSYSSRLAFSGLVGWGQSKFLGEAGRLVVSRGPPLVLGASRHDDYLKSSGTIDFSLNEHLKLSTAYSWFQNWSTLPYADFVRRSWTLNMSSRW